MVNAIDVALAPAGSVWLAVEKRRDSEPERKELLLALAARGFTANEVPLPTGLGPEPCVSTVAVYRCERQHEISQVDAALNQERGPELEPEPEPEPQQTAQEEAHSLRQVRVDTLVGEQASGTSTEQPVESDLLSDLD